MGLAENLKWSRQACDYVLNQVRMDGANWDQYRGAPSWESCIGHSDLATCAPLAKPVDICVYDVVRPKSMKLSAGKSLLQEMRIIARTASNNRCGNCGEFSATAFIWLYERGVRPLDWMELAGGDHAYVVIGRQAGDPADVSSWGPDAAVCDPWGQGFRSGDQASGTYPGTAFRRQMGGMVNFQHPRLIHRED